MSIRVTAFNLHGVVEIKVEAKGRLYDEEDINTHSTDITFFDEDGGHMRVTAFTDGPCPGVSELDQVVARERRDAMDAALELINDWEDRFPVQLANELKEILSS